jgi:hypothetical protein
MGAVASGRGPVVYSASHHDLSRVADVVAYLTLVPRPEQNIFRGAEQTILGPYYTREVTVSCE